MGVFLLNSNGYKDLVNNFYAKEPKSVNGLDNTSYFYYKTQLYNKIYSLFTFKNLPEHWNIDYINENLFSKGFMCCIDYNGKPWLLTGSYRGINIYNLPTDIIITNPVIGSLNRKIGVDSELVYFNRVNGFFNSLESLVTRYAVLLSQCDGSLSTTLINSRVAHVFERENDAEVQTLKKMYDEVSKGKPAIFIKKPSKTGLKENNNFNFLNVKNTYIGNDILITKRSIMNEFLTEIGINNANTDKRERLTNDEISVNNSEINSNITLWVDTLNRCFEKVNKMFGTNVIVEMNNNVHTTEREDIV